MPLNIDRVIGLSLGLGLGFVTISGLKCINSKRVCQESESTESSGGTLTCKSSNCSRVNMNLGLGMLGVASGLLVYRNYRIFH